MIWLWSWLFHPLFIICVNEGGFLSASAKVISRPLCGSYLRVAVLGSKARFSGFWQCVKRRWGVGE